MVTGQWLLVIVTGSNWQLVVGPQASLLPSPTPELWILYLESMKYHVSLVHASKAQLEPKWSHKVPTSLQSGVKSDHKRYPTMGVDSFL